MKKVLIASTALVAAGLLTAGTASASEKIKLNLGGYAKWWVVGAWQDSDFEDNVAGASTNVDVKGDTEVFFGGKTTLDNGIEVGIDVQLESGGDNSLKSGSDTIDESYVWVAGGFGKAIIGTENNGVYLLHVTAPDAAGNWNEGGMMTGNYSVNPVQANGGSLASAAVGVTPIGVVGGTNSTAIRPDNDADKITYVAPTFYGLTLGASYIPNALQEDDARVQTNMGTNNGGVFDNGVPAWGVGALYANTFGGVGVKLSAGYVAYDPSAHAGAFQVDDAEEWSVGTQLSYAGFTLGGSYRNADADVSGTAGANLGIGHAYDVGLQYASGPYAVSVAYFKSETDGDISLAGDDEVEAYQVSGKYTLGAGVDVLATVGHIEYKDGDSNATDATSNKAWVAMTGLSLAF